MKSSSERSSYVRAVFVCTRIWEKIGRGANKKERERVGGVIGAPEGLWDPRETLFDTGNRFVVVVTKSRKTGPLRPHCSERDWRKELR